MRLLICLLVLNAIVYTNCHYWGSKLSWLTDKKGDDSDSDDSSDSTGGGLIGNLLSHLLGGGSTGDDGDGSTDDGSTGNGSTGDGTTGDCSTGDGSTGDGSTGDGSTGDGSTGDGSTGDDTSGDCSNGDGSTGDGSTGNCSTGDGSTSDCSTGHNSSGDGSTGDGSTGDGSTGDGSTGDGSTGDGSTGDGSTGYGSTGDRSVGEWLSCFLGSGSTGNDGDGSTGDDSTGDGSTGDGSTGDGSTGDGSTGDGSTGDGSTGDSSAGDCTTANSSTDDGSTGDGSTGDGSTGDGSTSDGSTRDGSTDDCTTGDGSTSDGSTGDGTTGDGSTGDGFTGDGSTGDGSTGDGSTDDGSTGDGSTGDGSTGDESMGDGSTGDGSTSDGSTGDVSTNDGSTVDGSTCDGSIGDGSTGEGSTGDGSTGDGSTGDGSTGDGCTDAFERFKDRLFAILSLLLKHILKTTNGNVVVSPLAICYESIAFGIASTKNSTTLNEILNALALYSQEELYIVLSQLNKHIISNETEGTTLTAHGNCCFADKKYIVSYWFKQIFKYLIMGKAGNINVHEKYEAYDIMRRAISKGTKNHITEVITPGDGYLTPDTKILGIAAHFFQPRYLYEFKIGPRYLFHPDCEKCQTCVPQMVTYMEQLAISNYIFSEELDAHVVELEMTGYPNMSNYGILPRRDINIAIVNLWKLKNLIPKMVPTLTHTSVPVYDKYDTTMDTKDFVQKYLNINAMYKEGAEFSEVTKVDNNDTVYVSDSVHRVVYARGTNGGPWTENDDTNAVKITCNRPFLHVAIVDNIPVIAVVRQCPPDQQ